MARRFQRSRFRHEQEEPGVNLTPLIDVVFCILIMFIVVAPLLELDEVALAPANTDPARHSIALQEEGSIIVQVFADNTIAVNKHPVDASGLLQALRQEKALHPDSRPQLYHDKRAAFGTYQTIKNAAEQAGFEHIDVILIPG